MCLSTEPPKTINFLFVPNGKLMFLDVPIFSPIRVMQIQLSLPQQNLNYNISSVGRRSFSFQNNSIDLDPSCKMDLDLWDC